MKLAQLIIISAPLLLASCGWMDKAAADGTQIIVFALDEPVSIVVDDKPPIELGAKAFRRIAVGPGNHTIMIGDRKVEREFKAFDRYVIPVIDDQCFMSLDETLSHYGDRPTAAPAITGRKQASEPFALPSNNFLDESELPQSLKSGERALLFRSLGCAELDALENGTLEPAVEPTAEPTAVVSQLDETLAQLLLAADCPNSSANAYWCAAAQGWAGGSPGELPAAGQTFIGLTLELHDGGDFKAALAKPPQISVLALRPEGEGVMASLTSLDGDNDDEKRQISEAAISAQRYFSGASEAVEVDAGINGYLDTMAAAASQELTQSQTGWSAPANKFELRRVGEYWVSVEPFKEGGGVFFSIHATNRQAKGG